MQSCCQTPFKLQTSYLAMVRVHTSVSSSPKNHQWLQIGKWIWQEREYRPVLCWVTYRWALIRRIIKSQLYCSDALSFLLDFLSLSFYLMALIKKCWGILDMDVSESNRGVSSWEVSCIKQALPRTTDNARLLFEWLNKYDALKYMSLIIMGYHTWVVSIAWTRL